MNIHKLAKVSLQILEAGYKNHALRLLHASLHTAVFYRETPVDPSTDVVDLFTRDLKRHHDTRRSFIEVKPFFRNPKMWAPFQGRIKGADEKHLAYWVDKAKDLGIALEKSHMWEYRPSIPGGIGRHYFVSKRTMGHRELVFVLELNISYNRFVLSIRPLEELYETTVEDEEEEEEIWEEFLEGGDIDLDVFKKKAEEDKISFEVIKLLNDDIVYFFKIGDKKYIADLDNAGKVLTGLEAESWLNSSLDNAEDLAGIDPDLDLTDFWNSPSTLYHATDHDNIESIMESGLQLESKTRGMTNRWMGASVFTSTNPEAIHSYGDTILEIDTEAMKRDGYTPRVELEPGIVEYEAARSLLSWFDMDEGDYPLEDPANTDGVDRETIILNGPVPAKYLTVMD